MSSLIESSHIQKKVKKNDDFEPPSSLLVKFLSNDGTRVGPPIDLPTTSTSKQLEQLINSLLENDEPSPYAFYIKDYEVTDNLHETLLEIIEASKQQEGKQNMINYEETLEIIYQPLSVFRVRPVTRCLETMTGHTEAVLHVSYSPDGLRLASGGGDKAVRFWNTTTNMPYHTCIGHRNHVLCTAWAPDGSVFISADKSGEIRIWNPKTGEQIGQELKGHTKWITQLAFEPFHIDPSCNRFASSSKDQTIRVWSIKSRTTITIICGHTDSVESIRWGGAGLLYSCSRDRTIKVWAVDGSDEDGTVKKGQHKLVRTLVGHAHRINSLALNCDYILRTGPFELSPTYNKTDTNNKEKETLSEKDKLLESQSKALERYQALLGSDGEILASCSDDFTIFLWKPQEGKTPIIRMTGHQQAINHIAFSPDARFLASGSFDKKVKLWCGKTGRFLSTLNGHVGSVYQVSWSPDSSYIVRYFLNSHHYLIY